MRRLNKWSTLWQTAFFVVPRMVPTSTAWLGHLGRPASTQFDAHIARNKAFLRCLALSAVTHTIPSPQWLGPAQAALCNRAPKGRAARSSKIVRALIRWSAITAIHWAMTVAAPQACCSLAGFGSVVTRHASSKRLVADNYKILKGDLQNVQEVNFIPCCWDISIPVRRCLTCCFQLYDLT